ncbi:MAG: hypothetical protein H7178_08815 [Chitinophagaceae bacterium]|nr:hypothetical protein [Chitinophagaceae bacterium]
MRKLISILILASLLVYTGGNFVVFKCKQAALKQEMKAYLKANPNSSLATKFIFALQDLTSNHIDFQWEKYGDEFMYNGEMYDAVSTAQSNGTISIVAIRDNDENALMKNYETLLKHQTNKSAQANLLKFFSAFFLFDQSIATQFSSAAFIVHSSSYTLSFCNGVQFIDTPPPQV